MLFSDISILETFSKASTEEKINILKDPPEADYIYKLSAEAVGNSNIDVLNFLYVDKPQEHLWVNKTGIYSSHADQAAYVGSIKVLEWMKQNGFTDAIWPSCYTIAYRYKQFEVLDWLIENKICWDEGLIHHVIKEDKLEILRLLFSSGFSIDESAYQYAVTFDKMDILRWLIENAIPRPEKVRIMHKEKMIYQKIRFLHENRFKVFSTV